MVPPLWAVLVSLLLVPFVILFRDSFVDFWVIFREVARPRRKPEPTFEECYQAAMAVDTEPPPDWAVEVWTPGEREALGQNDLLRFIDETEKVLNPTPPDPISPERLYARGGYVGL